jgi:hypothetical protein
VSELAGRRDQAWREVVDLIERRTAADYDAAAGLLYELAEVGRRAVGLTTGRAGAGRIETGGVERFPQRFGVVACVT